MVGGVVTLCSALVLSQVAAPPPASTPPPPAHVTEAPHWSVGAGFGLFERAGQAGAGVLGNFNPTPRLAVERLFGDHFALGLGALATFQGGEADSATTLGVAATLAPRWIITNPDAIVGVSVWVAAIASYTVTEIPPSFTARGTAFGGLAGIALERTLVARLAIRLQLQLVQVTWNRHVRERRTPTPLVDPPETTRTESTTANFLPAPSVELRFYF